VTLLVTSDGKRMWSPLLAHAVVTYTEQDYVPSNNLTSLYTFKLKTLKPLVWNYG